MNSWNWEEPSKISKFNLKPKEEMIDFFCYIVLSPYVDLVNSNINII